MIVRSLEDILDTPRDVRGPTWASRRLILAADGMGCSLSDTIVKAGSEQHLHYKHHLETNYCLEGEGEVVDVKTGRTYPIGPGTVYALDKNDEHIVRAKTDLRFVCVFYPALTGKETHRPDGSYAPAEE